MPTDVLRCVSMRWALLVLVVAGVCASGDAAATRGSASAPTLGQLVGQRLVVGMRGTAPSAFLLDRVRAGAVGGVILFGRNVRDRDQVRALTAALRAAAQTTDRPPLLIAVDQEGGATRRFSWAAPSLSAAQLGRLAPGAVETQGKAAAEALHDVGVNVDLAPVADVPSVPGAFIGAQERAFSASPGRVGVLATAFAQGLHDGGVAATAKHFPGLGRARVSTDVGAVTLRASRSALDKDLFPYRPLIASGVPLVMLSNATYPALDAKPAVWSPAVQTLLRRNLGFTGATITDALDAAGPTHKRSVASVAVLSAEAGTDLLLVTGSELTSAGVYDSLLAAAKEGKLSRRNLERSYARIMALKRGL
jgi:beta-N-acetylhexosaminidase